MFHRCPRPSKLILQRPLPPLRPELSSSMARPTFRSAYHKLPTPRHRPNRPPRAPRMRGGTHLSRRTQPRPIPHTQPTRRRSTRRTTKPFPPCLMPTPLASRVCSWSPTHPPQASCTACSPFLRPARAFTNTRPHRRRLRCPGMVRQPPLWRLSHLRHRCRDTRPPLRKKAMEKRNSRTAPGLASALGMHGG